MRRPLRPLAAVAMVALISVISAGCSSASAGADTGSGGNYNQTSDVSTATMSPAGAGSSGATTTAATSSGGNSTVATAPAGNGSVASNAATRQQAVKFAECMRANGVKQFPDPGPSGELTIDQIANGSSLDTNSATFKQAISACRDLEPAGFTGAKRSPEQQKAALKFAQCIRDHGVKDFPDPAPDAPLVDTNRVPSTAKSGGMSVLHAAMQKCGNFAAAAGVTGGQ